jgi:hypothetical protein
MANQNLRWVVVAAVLSGIALAVSWISPSPLEAQEGPTGLSACYGFKKLEIFKLEHRLANMLAGDLNHDGLTDLVLVDNSHSRIDLLQQRKQKPVETTSKSPKRPVNALDNDWRFEHRKILVDKQIASLTLGDFNGDGRTDIAYFGMPDRLVVRHQPETGDWTDRDTFRLPEVPESRWNLAAGDLNNDGKDDLVILGNNETYVLYQLPTGKLAKPESLMNTSNKLSLANVADVDGDGRNDLCYVANDGQGQTLCARLQRLDGRLGPELRFDLNRSRAVTLCNIDGKAGHEILSVDSRTGRVKVLQLQRPASKPGELAGRLIQYGFGKQGSDRDRALATGDLDGDGLIDVVVTDPTAARMIVFRQQKDQGLDLGHPFPGLVGAEQIRLFDFDGDKAAEVVVLSRKEKTLGLSQLKAGRLTFPRSLPVENEPVALEVTDLNGDGRHEIVYLSKQRQGRGAKYALHALAWSENGDWKPYSFGKEDGKATSVPIETRGTPKRLIQLDANQDGRPDFLIFAGLDRAPLLLTTNADGIPTPVETRGGIGLGDISAGSIFIGQLEKPVVLAAQRNFARRLQLDENRQWRVIDQYNAAESNARVVGVATINLDNIPGNEVVLVDTGIRKLRVLRREKNIYRPWREIEIGAFPFKSTHVADLNGDGQHDLLLFGRGKFAVLYAAQTDPTLKELASFETKLDKTYFAHVAAGDLNGDGRVDLVAIDTRSHYVELLKFDAERGLRHALHFKLFEAKSFSRRSDTGTEPRETVIADVTADGRKDLILLTHDRVLVYPQDDGE